MPLTLAQTWDFRNAPAVPSPWSVSAGTWSTNSLGMSGAEVINYSQSLEDMNYVAAVAIIVELAAPDTGPTDTVMYDDTSGLPVFSNATATRYGLIFYDNLTGPFGAGIYSGGGSMAGDLDWNFSIIPNSAALLYLDIYGTRNPATRRIKQVERWNSSSIVTQAEFEAALAGGGVAPGGASSLGQVAHRGVGRRGMGSRGTGYRGGL